MHPPNLLPLAVAISFALTLPVTSWAAADATDTESDRIRVVADPLGDRGPDDLVRPVSVVVGEELERRRAASLGELLDGVPGVANSDFGPGVGRPTVRGLQGSRVQVLEDGLGTADVSREGADHAIAIDTARAAQIEVFRGPATLLYGSGAAGGVVNVVTRRFSPVVPESLRLEGRLAYGFNGNDQQARVGMDVPLSQELVVRADYSRRRTDNFDIKGYQQLGNSTSTKGELLASAVEQDAAAFSSVLAGDWGYLGLGVSLLDGQYDIPKLFDPRPRDQGGLSDHFDQISMASRRFDLRGERFRPLPGFATARLKMSHARFEQEEAELFFTRTPGGGVFDRAEIEASFENTEWDTRLELVHDPIGNWIGVVGLQFTDRDFFAELDDGEAFYVRPNRTRTLAAFVLEELPTDFGRIELGARIDRVRSNPDTLLDTDFDGISLPGGAFLALPEQLSSRNLTAISLSAGLKYNIGSDYHARAALTRSQRVPSPEQLYAFGRHAAIGTFEIGNPALKRETYNNFEIGFDRHAGPFQFESALFYNRVNDFIFLASEDDGSGRPVFVNDIGNRAGEGAAAGCAPGAGGLCRLRNQLLFNTQLDAEFYGVEFRSVSQIATGAVPLDLRLSGDYVRGKLQGGGGNLPRVTPMRLGAGIDTGYGDWTLAVDVQRVFRQTHTAVAESETGAYNLVGFDLVWTPLLFRNAQVFVQGRNLLNEDGRRHQSFFKNQAPIIGRSFMTGLRFQTGG